MEREAMEGLYGECRLSGTQVREGTCGMGKPRAESKGKSGCSGLGLREDDGASHEGGKEGWRSQVSKARVHFGAPEQAGYFKPSLYYIFFILAGFPHGSVVKKILLPM